MNRQEHNSLDIIFPLFSWIHTVNHPWQKFIVFLVLGPYSSRSIKQDKNQYSIQVGHTCPNLIQKLNPHMKLSSQTWQADSFAWYVGLVSHQPETVLPPQGTLFTSKLCSFWNSSLSQSFFTFPSQKILAGLAARKSAPWPWVFFAGVHSRLHPGSITATCLTSYSITFQIVSWKHRVFL